MPAFVFPLSSRDLFSDKGLHRYEEAWLYYLYLRTPYEVGIRGMKRLLAKAVSLNSCRWSEQSCLRIKSNTGCNK